MTSDVLLPPEFIQFLFSTKPKFDCYFKVGNKNQGLPERIGAVKLMLMAHSEVMRRELEESDLAEKGDVPVEDVHPETLRGMLKYVYGYDTTSELCFDEADDMLYVAEKYMMKTLKDKLALRLMQLLNPDNICSLLNNPACYTHLDLESAITEILRYETDRVLFSPQFLWMNAEGFCKILEQDGLVVPEIELWRAAIKWAKHRADSEDGKQLRKQISSVSKHLRLCTLTADELCEVIPSGVLTSDEVNTVCLAIAKREKPRGIDYFSSGIEPRRLLKVKTMPVLEKLLDDNIPHYYLSSNESSEYSLNLLTKKCSIKLLPLVFLSEKRPSMQPQHWTYKVECTTTITKVENPNNPNSSSTYELPQTFSFSGDVKYGVKFEVPLTVDGRNVILLPDTKYTVKLKVNGTHRLLYHGSDSCSNDHLIAVTLLTTLGGRYVFPSALQYRATAVK